MSQKLILSAILAALVLGFQCSYTIAQVKKDDEQAERNKPESESEDKSKGGQISDELSDDDFDSDSEPKLSGGQDTDDELDLDEDSGDDSDELKAQVSEPIRWPRKDIRSVNINIQESQARKPQDQSFYLVQSPSPAWLDFTATPKRFAWAAPNIVYNPLYFEDVPLERYGQTLGPARQSVRSALNFYKSAIFLPNQIWHDPVYSLDSPLGFCRPGNAVPKTTQRKYFGRAKR